MKIFVWCLFLIYDLIPSLLGFPNHAVDSRNFGGLPRDLSLGFRPFQHRHFVHLETEFVYLGARLIISFSQNMCLVNILNLFGFYLEILIKMKLLFDLEFLFLIILLIKVFRDVMGLLVVFVFVYAHDHLRRVELLLFLGEVLFGLVRFLWFVFYQFFGGLG